MVKLSREAVSLYYETRSCSAEQARWLLVTFSVSRVGFLQHSLRDYYSIKFIALSLYFDVNG